jgi:hypothetical protein
LQSIKPEIPHISVCLTVSKLTKNIIGFIKHNFGRAPEKEVVRVRLFIPSPHFLRRCGLSISILHANKKTNSFLNIINPFLIQKILNL